MEQCLSGAGVGDSRAFGASVSSGGGHIREVIVGPEVEPGDRELPETVVSPSHQGPELAPSCEPAPVRLLVNEDGRYVCALCHKTFKTVGRAGRTWLGVPRLLRRCLSSPSTPSPTG